MDAMIFKMVNDLAGNSFVLDEVMKFLSSYFVYGLVALLIILLLFTKQRPFAVSGILGILLGMIINTVITTIYSRPRPFVAHDVNLLIDKSPSASFPSDTALIAFAVACAIWLLSRKLGVIAIGLAVFVAISRLYVGHHYPSDVLFGGIIGVFSTDVGWKVYNQIVIKIRTVKVSSN